MTNMENENNTDDKNKYAYTAIQWLDKGDHYELIFSDDFETPADNEYFDRRFTLPRSICLADIISDMKNADTSKEVHVLSGLYSLPLVAVRLILQQLLRFEYRVGYHIGTTSFCGWILFFACQERYVSIYSSVCYRDISTFRSDKRMDNCAKSLLGNGWQDDLNKIIGVEKFLTAEELEHGRMREVWISGEELIKRGAAMLYKKYATRKKPALVPDVMEVNGMLYRKEDDKFVRYEPTKDEPVTYAELVTLCNTPKESENKGAKK